MTADTTEQTQKQMNWPPLQQFPPIRKQFVWRDNEERQASRLPLHRSYSAGELLHTWTRWPQVP